MKASNKDAKRILLSHEFLEKYNEQTLRNFCIFALLRRKMSNLSHFSLIEFSFKMQKVKKNLLNGFNEKFERLLCAPKFVILGVNNIGHTDRASGPRRLKA